jgi:hypothetical protein
MAVKLVVDKLEDAPEAVRTLYVEKDGKFHLQVEGLEDTSGLKKALDSERESARKARQQAKELEERFTGIDPEQVRDLMKKFEDDGEARLIKEGKIDEVVNKRLTKREIEFNKQLKAAQDMVEAEKKRSSKFNDLVLENQVRQAASAAGLHNHAIEDAMLRARSIFRLTEDGKAVQLGEDGTPVIGKDGKTPFSPAEWLEGMRDAAPHWFPAGNAGGGATGGKDLSGGNKVIKRAAWNALSADKKAEMLRTHTLVD